MYRNFIDSANFEIMWKSICCMRPYSFIGKRSTVLHLAASNGRSTALKLILRMISTVQNLTIMEYLMELLDENNVSSSVKYVYTNICLYIWDKVLKYVLHK